MQDPEDKLIVALDFPAAEPAMALVDQLGQRCRWVKVGLELFCATGFPFVEQLRARGLHVFLDLKLHDIPNTVAGAVRAVLPSGIDLLTVHGAGGRAMLEAAVAETGRHASPLQLLAVTVLTSMDASGLEETGAMGSPAEQVQRLARLAVAAGVPGLVCSAEEVKVLRQQLGPEVLLVVPGIRPAGAAIGDQRRVATAEVAMRDGASMLVVGRPITQAADPCRALEDLLEEIARSSETD